MSRHKEDFAPPAGVQKTQKEVDEAWRKCIQDMKQKGFSEDWNEFKQKIQNSDLQNWDKLNKKIPY